MLANRPDYLAAWAGIGRAGGVVALINTNLQGRSAGPLPRRRRSRHIIVEEDLAPELGNTARAKVWRR